MNNAANLTHPGDGLKTEKMPGHWVLARLGKRVLRPGGMVVTVMPQGRAIRSRKRSLNALPVTFSIAAPTTCIEPDP